MLKIKIFNKNKYFNLLIKYKASFFMNVHIIENLAFGEDEDD